jgi:FkbH-like protein
MELSWLPRQSDWNGSLNAARRMPASEAAPRLVELANSRIDFVQTAKLDRVLQQFGESLRPHLSRTPPVRLALIGSSTLAHLVPAIRVAAVRRGFWVDVLEGHYGMYRQELVESKSDLHSFKPDVVLIALDAHHIAAGDSSSAAASLALMQSCWKLAKEDLRATVIQQTILPVFPALMGNNEQHMETSPCSVIAEINYQLRSAAREAGVHLLAIDTLAQTSGIRTWFDPALWHRSKQEVHPTTSPLWGDQVGRLLAALRGLSYKCLVLDLDNTLWGGVVGDDGLEGILLGQGHPAGEAHVAFQQYAAKLASRGVILAVCSKNDDVNARAVFERHPDMILRMKDIACFVANWQDKAANLRSIANTLNIGLDCLVFADDNPFERNLVRKELPAVAVPELPEDPALYIDSIVNAGYFEAVTLTTEDRERSQQYQVNAERDRLRESATDMATYLRGLEMELVWSPFDALGLSRVTQLINKSNQFNLTTHRYTEDEVEEIMVNPDYLTLQLRLKDKFGDNGMISVIIGKIADDCTLELDTWLMSCRVLGRQVEEATLNLIVDRAKAVGMRRLTGFYLPTPKNGMVKEHYGRLGFARTGSSEDGSSAWSLGLPAYQPKETFILTTEGVIDQRTDLRSTHRNISQSI